MNKSIIFLITVFVPLLLFHCQNNNNPKRFIINENSHALILRHNTSIRIDPFYFSTRVDELSKGTVIKIIDQSKETSRIGKYDDFWYKVRYNNNKSGWIYGSNIRLINSNKRTIDQIIADIQKKDSEEMKKKIGGRWWSLNTLGEFSYYCIDLKTDNTYKSFIKGKEDKTKEGSYTIDIEKRIITFDNGFFLDRTLHFQKRGQTYLLYVKRKKNIINFKKIQNNGEETPSNQ